MIISTHWKCRAKYAVPLSPPIARITRTCTTFCCQTSTERSAFIAALKQKGIGAVFHYVPLDSSPMGEKHGRKSGSLTQTQLLSERLVRLPLWLGLEEFQSEVILEVIAEL